MQAEPVEIATLGTASIKVSAGISGNERLRLPGSRCTHREQVDDRQVPRQVLGVTESRICQMHTKAVLQLRGKLADQRD